MADFHQGGMITDLHPLYEIFDREKYLASLERKLEGYSGHIGIALLLPCIISEIYNPEVLSYILKEIQKVRYLHLVVVALGGAENEISFRDAKDFFSSLKAPGRDIRVVWVDGPRIQMVFEEIQNKGISTGIQGKGQSVWIALGYIFAREDCDVIAIHDCDILTYDRILLGRLIEPTANPNNDLEFCKGYYPRISPAEKMMKGRVTRLFVNPFVDAMLKIMHQRNFEDLERFFLYHRSFKYPLAGEFSFQTRLARGINIAYDWGLEISILSEVYHKVIPRKIAQIALVSNYEHKHQELSPFNPEKGLHRMVIDIAKFYLNYIHSHGVSIDDAFVEMIQQSYYQNALEYIKRYSMDSEVNDLFLDRQEEELTCGYFKDFIWEAWLRRKERPWESLIPSWNRVAYSVPDIYQKILEAVEQDNYKNSPYSIPYL